MRSRFENFLEALKIIGGIAKTVLSGLEEYRKIQETKAYRENKRNKVKYLPKPRSKKYSNKKKQR